MLHFDWERLSRYRPPKREPLAAQIIEQLRRDIVLGDLRERDRLPPLRTLAALYQVSIPTLRQALQALSYMGIVIIRPGDGTFVHGGRQSHRALIAGVGRASVRELADMRSLIEAEGASRAARSRDADPHGDMATAEAERTLYARFGEVSRFIAADIDFHYAILAASGFPYAIGLHVQLCERLHPALLRDAKRQAHSETLTRLHSELATAIDQHATERAAPIARQIAAAETPPRR